MGHLRFRRRIRILPGVSIDLNKTSVGITVGTRGAHYTINTKGRRTTTIGLPGTGLYYQDVHTPEHRLPFPLAVRPSSRVPAWLVVVSALVVTLLLLTALVMVG